MTLQGNKCRISMVGNAHELPRRKGRETKTGRFNMMLLMKSSRDTGMDIR
jgi:hypothetical protein